MNFINLSQKSLLNKNQIALLLKTTPEALDAFESAYQKQVLSVNETDNFFEVKWKAQATVSCSFGWILCFIFGLCRDIFITAISGIKFICLLAFEY